MKGKCAETFGPLGPWLVTRDEIEDVQNLSMSLDVNGQRRQTGNTKTMIFGIAHCLHYISQFMVLEPGDVVTTGTPPGVALGMKPPVWLKAGDVMTPRHRGPRRAEAEGRGVQGIGTHRTLAASRESASAAARNERPAREQCPARCFRWSSAGSSCFSGLGRGPAGGSVPGPAR